MLTFDFVVADGEAKNAGIVGGFTQGFLTVSGDFGTYPDLATAKSAWLGMLVNGLLGGLLPFLQTPTTKEWSMRTMYGDYGVKFFQNRHQAISVYGLGHKEILIGKTTPAELRHAVWAAVQRFYPAYEAFHQSFKNGGDYTGPFIWTVEADERIEFDDLCDAWLAAFPDLPPLTVE